MKLALSAISACLLFGASCIQAASPPPAAAADTCTSTAEANRELVLAFYRGALVERQPRAAFERYASADFVEHKPDVPVGSREATIVFLEGLITQLADARWAILRSAAQDDLVFVHATFTPAPGAPAYVLADVFRLSGCSIVEHWDVVGAPRPDMPNPNPRY